MIEITNEYANQEQSPSPFHRRLHHKRHIIKSFKARANANRKPAEKLADFLTALLGSMSFLGLNAAWFLLWILINTGHMRGIPIFDPFPFGLLTMIVSLEAIFLAINVLISQNRASKIDDLREEIALHIDTRAEEEITKMIELQIMMLKQQGLDVSKDPELLEMLKPTDTNKIERELEKQVL